MAYDACLAVSGVCPRVTELAVVAAVGIATTKNASECWDTANTVLILVQEISQQLQSSSQLGKQSSELRR
jgi:hypothetical protein